MAVVKPVKSADRTLDVFELLAAEPRGLTVSEISDRLVPGLALTSLLRARGADVFRVHDVKENVYALRVTEAILQRAK